MTGLVPIKVNNNSGSGVVYHCKNCSSTNIMLVVNSKGDYKFFDYCPDCGTKVNWNIPT